MYCMWGRKQMSEMSYQLSQLTALNNRLQSDEAMYKMICESSADAFVYFDYAQKSIVHLGNWSHFFDFELNYNSLSHILSFVEDEYQTDLYDCLTLEHNYLTNCSVEFKRKDRYLWIRMDAIAVYSEDGVISTKLLHFTDITKNKQLHEEIDYLAYYDMNTGLLNRNYFIVKLGRMLEKAKSNKDIVSVLFVDVDHFRRVNDGMGMLMGDELIQIIGQQFKELTCENVMVSHFNTDVFCIAIYDPCGYYSVDSVISEIKRKLDEPIRLSNSTELNITVSIGVAEYPECAHDALSLINCAEIVMFKSKRVQKNGVQYYDSPIIQEFIERVHIEQRLERALRDNGFFMCYQPQYSTDGKTLRGLEALVRWQDEDGKIISPATFIPLAEKNGSILRLGDWIMEKSISDFANWRQKFYIDDITLSINISALQFKNKGFIKTLMNLLEEYHIPSHLIELEITESVFIEDMEDVIDKMNTLREMGVRFSMDDFGTGFSSLSYLRKLPIDTLKIDKSFIDSVVTDSPTRMIAETIIDMGKKLGFHTIAEGVEDEVQFDILRDIGCDNIQGFYLGRPMISDNIEILLAERN